MLGRVTEINREKSRVQSADITLGDVHKVRVVYSGSGEKTIANFHHLLLGEYKPIGADYLRFVPENLHPENITRGDLDEKSIKHIAHYLPKPIHPDVIMAGKIAGRLIDIARKNKK